MASLFKRTGYISPQASQQLLGDFDLAGLPSLLRVLLTCDGTVTKSLEAYFWEPVTVQVESQYISEVVLPVMPLGLEKGTLVLFRRVLLEGKHSKSIYGWAESIIVLNRLEKGLADKLIAGEMGIGQLLRHHVLETYREVLGMGYSHTEADAACEVQKYVARQADIYTDVASKAQTEALPESVWRLYRVLMQDLPVILIKEVFPLNVYR